MDSPVVASPGGNSKKRRSWFEANTGMSFEIAVEKKATPVSPTGGSADVEVLELTHFSKPPRIDFGKVRLGKSKMRYLKVVNPHDYSQSVVIEKFPFHKNFHVDMVEFEVEPEEERILTITWNPEEPGNAREMVLIKVEDAYRLQTIMFGSAEEPPRTKKARGLRRAPIQKKKPFSTSFSNSENTTRDRSPLSPKNARPSLRPTFRKPTKDIQVEFFSKETKENLVHAEEVKENVTIEHFQTSQRADATRTISSKHDVISDVTRTISSKHDVISDVTRTISTDANFSKTFSSVSETLTKIPAGNDVTMTLPPSNDVPEWAIPKLPVRPSFGPGHVYQAMTFTKEQDAQESMLSSMHMDATQGGSTSYLKYDGSVMETPVPKFASTFMQTPGVADVRPDCKDGAAPAPVQALFVQDDPSIPGTPPRRTTFIKDDPTLPESPLRRTTFVKPQAAFPSPLAAPRLPFTPPDTLREGEEMMFRRTTFEKDDPSLPATPIRRDTFQKWENACSNTPTIAAPGSASPARRPPHSVHFSDDTRVHNLSIPGTDPSSNLRRSGTYTKLNSSLSPRPAPGPSSRPGTAASPEVDMSFRTTDIIGSLFQGVTRGSLLSQPGLTHQDVLNDSLQRLERQGQDGAESATTATYVTPLTTPYRSPASSPSPASSDGDIFEDSVSFLPDQTSEWRESCHTVLEERVVMETKAVTMVTEQERVWSRTPDTLEGFKSATPSSGDVTEICDDVTRRAVAVTDVVTEVTERVFEMSPIVTMETVRIQPSLVSMATEDPTMDTVSTTVKHSCSGTEQVTMATSKDLGSFLRQLGRKKRGSRDMVTIDSEDLSGNHGDVERAVKDADILPEYLETLSAVPAISRLKRNADRYSVDSLEPDVDDRSSSDTSAEGEKATSENVTSSDDVAAALEKTWKKAREDLQTGGYQGSSMKGDASPHALLSDSFSHQEVVQQLTSVKAELRSMYASTPVAEQQGRVFHQGNHTNAPSPIIDLASPLPASDVGCPVAPAEPKVKLFTKDAFAEVKPQPPFGNTRGRSPLRKADVTPDDVFPEIPEPEPRRISSLTVTKSRPEVLGRGGGTPGGGGRSRKELFLDTPESERQRRRIRSTTVTKSVSELSFTEADLPEAPEGPGVRGSTSESAIPEEKSAIPRGVKPAIPGGVESAIPGGEMRGGKVLDEDLTEELLYSGVRKRDRSGDVPHRGVPFQPRGRTPLKLRASRESLGESEEGRRYAKPWRHGQARPRVSLSAGRAPLNTTAPLPAEPDLRRTTSADRAAPTRRKYASGPVRSGSKPEGSKAEGKADRGLAGSHKDRSLTRTQQLRRKAALAGMSGPPPAKSAPPKPAAPSATVAPKPKPPARGKSKSLAKGLAQSKLMLNKKTTAIPKHPMPYAGKNMFYDERWMEKEERGFVKWLNFILTPPDEYVDAHKPKKIDAGSLFMDGPQRDLSLAPSKEYLSLKAYTARRRLNRLRHKACLLFQGPDNVRVIQKLEKEVERRGIAVRKDRKIHADLGIKQTLLDMMLSYNPLWLRIGLETVFGELIPLQSNCDVYGLSRFIVHRMLMNQEIAARFAHPTVPHLYNDGYDEALAQFILKKFLMLVMFLDRAKRSRLIEHDPCLFCVDSEYKASRDLLLTFSRDYLSGEGDLTKHLGYLGYLVCHAQTALEEYDYAVTNLAVDLRDGLKISRVLEMLTNSFTLSPDMRVPAISRLQKIHNVGVAFRELSNHGIEFTGAQGYKIDSRDLVDGHREKTLHVLWRIIFSFQVEVLLNERLLRQEIHFLKENFTYRTRLEAILSQEDENLGLPRNRRESTTPDLYFTSPRLSLLLKWCRAVCAYYNMKVENFTVSFSDGRALCYLVHHYHPSLLPLDSIHTHTTLTIEGTTELNSDNDSFNDSFEGLWTQTYSPTTGKPSNFDKLLENERQNFKLLYEKVQELGGVPVMLKSGDMSNTIPDEKVVITYVTYLCARLLDIRHETRAARVIQAAWRSYSLRKHASQKQARTRAALVIQRSVRRYLLSVKEQRYREAALVLQAQWRGILARRQAVHLRDRRDRQRLQAAATLIQAHVRGYLCRQEQMYRGAYATVIQSAWRGYRVRREIHTLHTAAYTVQSAWRARGLGRGVREAYLTLRAGTVTAQAVVRGFLARRRAQRERAARRIQAAVLGFLQRQNYRRILDQRERAVIAIQAAVRGFIQRQNYRRILDQRERAATAIQAAVRGYMARRRYRRERAATRLQACWRSHKVRTHYLKVRNAALRIQTWARMRRESGRYQRVWLAAVVLQRAFRARQEGRKVREVMAGRRRAALLIQSVYRGHRARLEVKRLRTAERSAKVIQAAFRGHLVRKALTRKIAAATLIQSLVRTRLERCRYMTLKTATMTLQMRFRACLAGRRQFQEYQRLRSSVILLQSVVRGMAARRLARDSRAARTLQSHFRGYRARMTYRKLRNAAVILQRRWRGVRKGREARRGYHALRGAVITMQAGIRGWVARRQQARQHRAAVCIQAQYRGYCVRRQQARQHRAAVCIQAQYRGYCVRRQQARQHRAAVCIQAQYRGYKSRGRYHRLLCAALVIQIHYRAHLKMLATREEYRAVRGCVVTAQAVVRGFLARRRAQRERAARRIQAAVRGFLQRQNYRRILEQRERAATAIQAAVRGYMARRRYRRERAARRIQAAVRGYMDRRRYKRVRAATLVLQTSWRRYACRVRYLAMQGAARVIQARYRGVLQTRAAVQAYRRDRGRVIHSQAAVRGFLQRRRYRAILDQVRRERAATRIQAAVRGFQQRKRYTQYKNAAVRIQAEWKRYCLQRSYQQARKAARVIQNHFRAHVMRAQVQERYRQLRSAAITLQSVWRRRKARTETRRERAARKLQAAWRMYVTRRSYVTYRRHVITIQNLYRAHAAKVKYNHLRASVVTLQRRWRALQSGRQHRMQYYVIKGAAINIQAAVRGHQARKRYRRMRDGFSRLQATWRARVLTRELQEKKEACSRIQAWYRACAKTRQEVTRYQRVRQAVVRIQAAVRRHQREVKYKALRLAAVVTQRRYRAVLEGRRVREEYHRTRQAVLTLQARVRAVLEGRRVREEYHRTRQAVLTLQARVRAVLEGRRVREEYHRTRRAVLTLQTWVRAVLEGRRVREEYHRTRRAVLTLQARVRAVLEGRRVREEYHRTRRAVLTLQARVRGTIARRHARHQRAARRIQATWRGYQQRRRYIKVTAAAIILQAHARRYIQQTRYFRVRTAALTLQKHFRATLQRTCAVREFRCARERIIRAQAAVRGWRARWDYRTMLRGFSRCQALQKGRCQRVKYSAMRLAAACIQRWYRTTTHARAVRRDYVMKKSAAVQIQALWRGHQQRALYTRERRAVILLQSRVRTWMARRRYVRLRHIAVTLQTRWRALVTMRRARVRFLIQKGAVMTLQSAWRGRVQRRRYVTMVTGFTRLQATFRMRRQRREFSLVKQAVTRIEARYLAVREMREERGRYRRMRGAVVRIQAGVRGMQARREVRRVRAAVRIQAAWRMYRDRRQYRTARDGVVRLQAAFRARLAHRKYVTLRNAAKVIQVRYRARRQGALVKQAFLKVRRSVVTCQAVVRGFLARRRAQRERAARRIQAAVRGFLQRQNYRRILDQRERAALLQKQSSAASLIQKIYRAYIVRKQQQAQRELRREELMRFAVVCRNHLSVIRIQRAVRRYRSIRLAKEQLQSVVMVQRWWRAKLERVRYLRLARCILLLQRASRDYLRRRQGAVVLLQAAARGWLARRDVRQRNDAAATIQAAWKGYRHRRAVKCKKIRQARRKVQEATKNATEDRKLCNRTSCALDYLLKYKQLAYILEAVMNLELVTRLSPRCCERLVEGQAVPVLYRLILSCNRSIPHMEIIKYNICILLNLAKYEKTVEFVVQDEENVETLVELIAHYREKGAIFTKSCTLLGIVCYETRYKQLVLSMPKVLEKLASVNRLLQRKHAMDEKRRVTKSKMAAAKNYSMMGAHAPTPAKRMRIRPEWVLRRHSVREIEDPLRAIKFLLHSLGQNV